MHFLILIIFLIYKEKKEATPPVLPLFHKKLLLRNVIVFTFFKNEDERYK